MTNRYNLHKQKPKYISLPGKSVLLSGLMLFVIFFQLNTLNLFGQTVVTYTTPGDHEFIVPAGVTEITVEAWGGGGAGGGARSGRGGGGAGGAYVRSTFAVEENTVFDIWVAEQKICTTHNSSSASNKGNSSWIKVGTTTILLADGGNGGAPGIAGNGAAGSGTISTSIGTIRYRGGSGFAGTNSNNGPGGGGAGSTGPGQNATTTAGGAGTDEYGGYGGGIVSNNTNGEDGGIYGGGGSGAKSNNNNQERTGGAGAQGLIRITYTISNLLTAEASTTPSCQGAVPGTGSIIVTASGGNPPYEYQLDSGPFQESNIFTNIESGTYSVTVRDASFTLFTLDGIIVGTQLPTMPDLTAVITNSACNIPNGAITVTNIPTSLEFSKTNSTYIDLGGSWLNNLSQFTLEGWIKIDKSMISGDRTWGLFGQNDAIEFGIMNSTTMQLWTSGGGSINIAMTEYPDDNDWHHIAAIGTGNSLMVFIDGVEVTSSGLSNSTSNYGSSSYHSMIGGRIWDATGNYLDGSILKTGFWDRALTVQEIIDLANTPFIQYSDSENGLIAGYNYFEGSGDVLSEVGAATVNGLLMNSPEWVEVFTYSWIKSEDPSFSASTKNISALAPGTYSLTSSFVGICPATGTWIVGTSGVNLWTGATDSDWNKISNWTCAIPDLTIDAVIPAGLSIYPVLSTGLAGLCKNLQIESGASLIIDENTLSISGELLNSGILDVTQGTLELTGNSAQVIPANSITGNAIQNLIINNPNGVSLNGTLYVYGVLKVTSGIFTTNDHLTLLSTPIQTALIDGSGMGEVTGNVTMQRFLPRAFGYKYFSSPFTDATVEEYAQEIDLNASFATLYYYNEDLATTGWQAYTSTSGILQPGSGYALNFGAEEIPATVNITGTVNNGNISIDLYNHDQPYTKGFNLVGNPYPSPIDWNAQGWSKINIDDALYFFDAGSDDQYTGSYSTYINGISSNGEASNIIASQQGFFIHVSDGSYPVQGTLTLTNQVRVNNLNPAFHKNTLSEERPLIRLSATYESTRISDYLAVYMDESAVISFNSDLDALKLKNTDPSIPSIYLITEENRETSIKSVPYPSGTALLDIGFSSKVNGRFKISAEDIDNIPTGYHIYLKDVYAGKIHNLSLNPDYSFTGKNETIDDRFKLIISNENLKTDSALINKFSVYSNNGVIYFSAEVFEQGMMLQLTDLTGRIIAKEKLAGNGEMTFSGIKSHHIYVISLITSHGVESKKLYVD